MGIFSLFGKSLRSDTSASELAIPNDDTGIARDYSAGHTTLLRDLSAGATQAATASTTMKIDAIESEMSSEFMHLSTAANSSMLGQSNKAGDDDIDLDATHVTIPMHYSSAAASESSLNKNTQGNPIEVSVSATLAVIEEAAVLFANQQTAIAEQLLR
ncbi:MAG: hypothetical protein NWQ13_00670, partial [Glaciimonas sp.]|nr:hypothetical protein [Glaciimonas sp.]